jgi:acyl-CoA dehydrogenase
MDCLAMSEPDAGSDVRGMKCTARRDGDDWILNGSKHFISHADIADFAIVFVGTGEEDGAARDQEEDHRLPGRPGTPGFTVRPDTARSRIAATTTASSPSTAAGCPAQILGEVHRGIRD